MKSFFPDINVWIALAFRGHQHHPTASRWFENLGEDTAGFCRFTQLGFLRLITLRAVMQDDVRTHGQAWEAYDLLTSDSRVVFYSEPDASVIDNQFRVFSSDSQSSSGQWSDAYLAAFASAARLSLVTFDRGLSRLAGHGSHLLK